MTEEVKVLVIAEIVIDLTQHTKHVAEMCNISLQFLEKNKWILSILYPYIFLNRNGNNTFLGLLQLPQKINKLRTILGDHIMGPIFLEVNLNGLTNLKILQETIASNINMWLFETQIKFQQDGAPQHYFRETWNFFYATYLDRWIVRRRST